MDLISAIHKTMAPIVRRVRLMVSRGVLERIDDGKKCQTVQVSLLADEIRDGVERFQEYGYTSHPFPGAEVIQVAVGGSRDHGVIIACEDRRYRVVGLQEGEVALYTDEGVMVHMKRGGGVDLGNAPQDFPALAGRVLAELQAVRDDLAAVKAWNTAHPHADPLTGTSGPSPLPWDPSVPHDPQSVAARKVRVD